MNDLLFVDLESERQAGYEIRGDVGGLITDQHIANVARREMMRRGKFGFIDTGGGKLVGDQKLECELTVKGGQVVWDLNGMSRSVWTEGRKP